MHHPTYRDTIIFIRCSYEWRNYIRAGSVQSQSIDSRNSLIAPTPTQIERLKSIFLFDLFHVSLEFEIVFLFCDSERCVYANFTRISWNFSIN